MKFIKKYKFFIFVLVLIILKQLLMSHTTIFAIGDSGCDDQLMVKLASSLLKLDWLGTYNHLTHVKGVFFPFFLAVNTTLGISYIDAVTLLYSLSCLFFVCTVKDMFKKGYMKYILFIVLLFNPIMMSSEVVQRVYRNSLTPSQVLIIIGSVFYIFKNRKTFNIKMLLMSIICGLTLASFYNTREDAIWILPFMLVFTLIMLIEHIVVNKKKLNIKFLGTLFIPFIVLFLCNTAIKLVNYKAYGVMVRVDEDDTPFSKVIETIYSVPPKEEIEYVSVTKEKLERIYEVSPTLKSIEPELSKYISIFEGSDRHPNDGEVEDGWFWWTIRFAAYEAGYYKDAKTADKFYTDITNEIVKAQEEGKLEKGSTMPSALMSPWRKGYSKKLASTLVDIYKYTNSYEDVGLKTSLSSGSSKNIGLFEILTNNKAIYPYSLDINGSYNSNTNSTISILYKDEVLDTIECNNNCNINFETTSDELDEKNVYELDERNVYVKINENNTEKAVNIYEFIRSEDIQNEYSNLKLNYDSNYDVTTNQLKVASIYNAKSNIISIVYKKTGLILGIVSLLLYIFITVIALFKNHKLIDKWLIISSVFASYLVLLLGVSYNHISSCYSITTLYLCGAYPLIIVFNLLTIFTFIDLINKNKKELKSN